MGVVELRRVPPIEAANVGGRLEVNADHVLQRAGDEEVLLGQAKAAARFRLVVRVEHLADGLRADLLLDGAPVVAHVERLEVEGLRGLGSPEAKQVGVAHPVSEDRRVAGLPSNDAIGNPADALVSPVGLVPLGPPPKTHVEGDLGSGDLPGVAQVQPLVGHLHLPAVTNGLVEDAELVSDAVADGRDLQRRKRVHVAGRQPAEPPITQPGSSS